MKDLRCVRLTHGRPSYWVVSQHKLDCLRSTEMERRSTELPCKFPLLIDVMLTAIVLVLGNAQAVPD